MDIINKPQNRRKKDQDMGNNRNYRTKSKFKLIESRQYKKLVMCKKYTLNRRLNKLNLNYKFLQDNFLYMYFHIKLSLNCKKCRNWLNLNMFCKLESIVRMHELLYYHNIQMDI